MLRTEDQHTACLANQHVNPWSRNVRIRQGCSAKIQMTWFSTVNLQIHVGFMLFHVVFHQTFSGMWPFDELQRSNSSPQSRSLVRNKCENIGPSKFETNICRSCWPIFDCIVQYVHSGGVSVLLYKLLTVSLCVFHVRFTPCAFLHFCPAVL